MQESTVKKHKRKIKWIRPDIQGKIVLSFIVLSTVVLIINNQFFLLGIWALQSDATEAQKVVLLNVSSLILEEFFISIIVGLLLSFFIGVYYSFKFSGPIYRMNTYMRDLVDGRWDLPCNLRKGDELQDMKDNINRAVAALTNKVTKQRELLVEAREALESSKSDDVTRLVNRIELLDEEIQKRFQAPEKPEKQEAVEQQQEEPVTAEVSS